MTSTLSLNSTYINDTLEALAYRLDKPEHDSVNELLSLYNPLSGPIRKLVTYYGAAGGFPVHSGTPSTTTSIMCSNGSPA